jgi:glycosyltransferase involved in cell wall biosynthesis
MPQSKSFAPHNIGFVSTRFGSTDGVSLETEKWAHVLKDLDQNLFYFAGMCDRPAEVSYVVPEAYFGHSAILGINNTVFGSQIRPPDVTRHIHELRDHLKHELYSFVSKFDIQLLIVENALSIPMNIPFGLALTEFIAETGIPTIGHHHDFFWERQRYLINCVEDYLEMAFPPGLSAIKHVVINSMAAAEVGRRRGASTWIIPNVMDFDNPPPPPDDYTAHLRSDLKVQPDEYFILQPTRIVRRKGIELAIELVKRLGLKARLVISHAGGDEGNDYERHVHIFSELLDVPVEFVSGIISTQRGSTPDGRKIYSLGDVYHYADLVTYPSLVEGFGNAFLEAIYYSRPMLVNNFAIYAKDIKIKGFKMVEFDGFITEDAIRHVQRILQEPDYTREMTGHNYELSKRFYSFTVLENHLRALLQACIGQDR